MERSSLTVKALGLEVVGHMEWVLCDLGQIFVTTMHDVCCLQEQLQVYRCFSGSGLSHNSKRLFGITLGWRFLNGGCNMSHRAFGQLRRALLSCHIAAQCGQCVVFMSLGSKIGRGGDSTALACVAHCALALVELSPGHFTLMRR